MTAAEQYVNRLSELLAENVPTAMSTALIANDAMPGPYHELWLTIRSHSRRMSTRSPTINGENPRSMIVATARAASGWREMDSPHPNEPSSAVTRTSVTHRGLPLSWGSGYSSANASTAAIRTAGAASWLSTVCMHPPYRNDSSHVDSHLSGDRAETRGFDDIPTSDAVLTTRSDNPTIITTYWKRSHPLGGSVHHQLEASDWVATFEDGTLISLHSGDGLERAYAGASPLRIEGLRSEVWEAGKPRDVAQPTPSSLTLTWQTDRPAPLELTMSISLTTVNEGVAIERRVTTTGERLDHPIAIQLPLLIDASEPDERRWVPRDDGVRAVVDPGSWFKSDWVFWVGGPLRRAGAGRLGIPMISSEWTGSGWTSMWCADPCFSTRFAYPGAGPAKRRGGFTWALDGQLGSVAHRHTVFDCLIPGGDDVAVDTFHRTAIADVPPGPAWLHDIAMVGIDFLSVGGQGWFDEVDALAAALNPDERARVALCIDGWIDSVGSNGFDHKANRMRTEWNAFAAADETGTARKPDLRRTHDRADDGRTASAPTGLRPIARLSCGTDHQHRRARFRSSGRTLPSGRGAGRQPVEGAGHCLAVMEGRARHTRMFEIGTSTSSTRCWQPSATTWIFYCGM